MQRFSALALLTAAAVAPAAMATVVACWVNNGPAPCCDAPKLICNNRQGLVWLCQGSSTGAVNIQVVRPVNLGNFESGQNNLDTSNPVACTTKTHACGSQPGQCLPEVVAQSTCVNTTTTGQICP